MDLVQVGFGPLSLSLSLFSSSGEEIIIAATTEMVADKKHKKCAFFIQKNIATAMLKSIWWSIAGSNR